MAIFFIAEAGVNHNGNKDMAFQLIDAAVAAGADAVKFQTFSADALASHSAPKAAYQNETTGVAESQRDMLKRLELPLAWHAPLRDYCRQKGVTFLSTPFDTLSLHFLVDELGLETIKVPSGEVTNGPFLLQIAESGCDIILSTGMSTLDEINAALEVIAFGLLGSPKAPSQQAFAEAFASEKGQEALRQKVTLLHCTSAYPTPLDDANVRAMVTMLDAFDLKVGYSDHTEGSAAAFCATALGAHVIEKHFTLDRNLPGPDHKASLEPTELKALIDGIRAIEIARGDGIKKPRASEADTAAVVRKSLVTLKPIKSGDRFTAENLGAKRPGNGVSPMQYWRYIGQPASRNFEEDETI